MTLRRFDELVDELLALPGRVRIVGIDGLGGSGKTTFAARLAAASPTPWPVVHTDDFASHDEPTQWWPRMLTDVVEPLLRGQSATYRAYDWVRREPGDVITVEPVEVVVIEGVGATRSAWRDRLVRRIWVDAPRDVRLRRGIERDGEELREFWTEWMTAEDGYVAQENPKSRADVVVDGSPPTPHGDDEFVTVSEPR